MATAQLSQILPKLHRHLMPTYTDKDMHDVTAFLVTLK